MGAAALAVLPLALLSGHAPVAGPTVLQALNAAGLVLVGSLLPFALFAYGQARVTAEVAGAFANLEPLVGAATGALAFGDPFDSLHALGALAVVGGIALSSGAVRPRRLPFWAPTRRRTC
jgi:drug/metabolite transporter (DMT)-like permease